MYKKNFLLGLALTLLLLTMFGAMFVTPVAADSKILRVPENYSTIQAAVDAANPGDTIQVASGIYFENVKVGKSVKIVGEGSETTIIDGNGTDTVVRVTADGVVISGFTIQRGVKDYRYCPGIYLYGSSGATISNNVVSNNSYGILLERSGDSIVSSNMVIYNHRGIELVSSSGNIVRDNIVTLNRYDGIYLFSSEGNTIVGNMVSYNGMPFLSTHGIHLGPCSSGNILYHNNVVNNTDQAYENKTNTWDNGVEGNYWSDYEGVDDGSGGRVAGDGIGDTLLPHLGLDYYPLMEPWSQVRVFDGIVVFSNSTIIAGFNFSAPLMRISFSVLGPPGTVGFCNVTVLKSLFSGIFMVLIDGVPIDYILSWNATCFFLYFTYSHGVHSVVILDIFGILVKSWYKGVGDLGYDERADLSGDSFVDVDDLQILAHEWYKL